MAKNQKTQFTKQNPKTQYPKLTIPPQRQDEPGLDEKLQPLADHGQTSYKGLGRLSGRKALITGGDSGIGRAVAIAYAREGADVAINYLPSEEADAKETIRLMKEAGQTAVALPGDISNEAFCSELVDAAAKKLGGLDIVVNNAGKQIFTRSLEELSTEQFEQTFRVNVFALIWIVKAALSHLDEGATIINTTSIQAYQPSPEILDYAATKAAIVSLTKSLSLQLIKQGIRVNGVAPGPIWTPLQPSYGQPMEKLVKFGQNTPYERAGQPAELAPTYVFLASQESSYINGEIIGVTGGRLLS